MRWSKCLKIEALITTHGPTKKSGRGTSVRLSPECWAYILTSPRANT